MKKVVLMVCALLLSQTMMGKPVVRPVHAVPVDVGDVGYIVVPVTLGPLVTAVACVATYKFIEAADEEMSRGDQSNQHPDIAKALGYSKVFSKYTVALYDLANLSKADLNALVKFIEEGTPDVLPKSGEGTVSLMSDHQVFARINTGKKLLVLHPACIKSADSQEPTYTHYVKAQK